MDDQLRFPPGQDSLLSSNSFEPPPPPSTQSFAFSNTTWPLLYPHTMPDQNGLPQQDSSLHATTAASRDMKSSIASPMDHPLPSPAFSVSHPAGTSSLQPNPLNASAPLGLSPQMAASMSPLQLGGMPSGQIGSANLQIRTSMSTSQPGVPSADPTLQQALQATAAMLHTSPLSFPLQGLASHSFADSDSLPYGGNFDMPLHPSPTDEFISTTQAQMQQGLGLLASSAMDPMTSMGALATSPPVFGYQEFPVMAGNFQDFLGGMTSAPYVDPPMATLGSPDQAFMISRSLSSISDGDNSWTMIDRHSDHQATLSPVHNRSDSSSSHHSDHAPPSAVSSGSFEEIIFHVSPEPESQSDHPHSHGIPIAGARHYPFENQDSEHSIPSPPLPSPHTAPLGTPSIPIASAHSPTYSSSSSSSPSAGCSPKAHRRSSPPGITPKIIAKKKSPMSSASKEKPEKRIGRRRGPLRPEQREQAHEIRKLRACLRCKFLKKVCDKGNPCGGCQPSHARLWQVPCTRIDIKDIGYFLKDWNADYERHITLGFSVANIKGFDNRERLLYITHGYGFVMPIWAREVYVRDDKCFGMDWLEQKDENQRDFEVQTAKLSAGAEGISKKMVSEYVDLHLDSGFDHFVDEYFDGTPFLSELLKSINRHYLATKQENLRKGLRLVVAYALTLHITMINGLTEEEASIGKIDDPTSRYFGETCAPVMINFEVKKAMADLWRELMIEVLTELSALYSSVYAGHKQKNWPTIFMLAALILSVWEMMQFDCHYRVPDEVAVNKFCEEMEHVPVGVIVGLFGAISTKLPNFQEWDSHKHGNVFNNNQAVCDTIKEVRSHIEKHDTYLRTRNEAKFCRDDFDCLSNKFLSKLVIRA